MKKGLLILICLLAVLSSSAQLLWKVSGHGLSQPSYLFGTHHLIPVSFLDSVPGLFKAFNRCDAVVGEMVMNNIDASEKIMQASMLPDGLTMDSLLSENDYALVDLELRSILKIGLKELGLMKPAAIRTLYELEVYKQVTGFADDIQADTYFQVVATEKGKKVVGLEDVDTQIRLLFGSKDLKREAHLLVETIRHKQETVKEINTLNALYKAGRIEELMDRTQTQGDPMAMTDAEYECLVDERNRTWTELLPEHMHAKSCFIAVGAMHLAGENGLIKLLRKKGYKVKEVKQ